MRRMLLALFLTTIVAGFTVTVGCDDNKVAAGDGGTDGGSPDGGPGCVTNPQTHLEIINACTGSEVVKIDRRPMNLPSPLPTLP